jgi:hypothetical protein
MAPAALRSLSEAAHSRVREQLGIELAGKT